MSGAATPTTSNEQAGGVSAALPTRVSNVCSYLFRTVLPSSTRLGRPSKPTWILVLLPEVVRSNSPLDPHLATGSH